jgi:hypothetical protein
MRSFTLITAFLITTCFLFTQAISEEDGPGVSFSGYLDSDVWTDFAGHFYTNDELDIGTSIDFSDKVSAHVYATVRGGNVPAGYGAPANRWGSLLFDGVDITFESSIGTFAVGDLVNQYGHFTYYLYKRLSMITAETFTRGLSYSIGNDMFEQSIIIGVSDLGNSIGNVNAASSFSFSETQSLGIYYGISGDIMGDFKNSGSVFAGAEYNGSFGDVLGVKFDLGWTTYGGDANTIALLAEPTLTFGDFSTAFSYYQFFDPDSTGTNPVGDEMYMYVEPGYSFTDNFAFGLPLEIHTTDVESFSDAGAFWVVPTFYIYPTDNVEWWIWGQMVKPFLADADMGYGLGSEIIVNF